MNLFECSRETLDSLSLPYCPLLLISGVAFLIVFYLLVSQIKKYLSPSKTLIHPISIKEYESTTKQHTAKELAKLADTMVTHRDLWKKTKYFNDYEEGREEELEEYQQVHQRFLKSRAILLKHGGLKARKNEE